MEKLERLFQARYQDSSFHLANYFDLIVGSGFNSILAVELSQGKSVREIEPVFKEVLSAYFCKKNNFLKQLYYRYDPLPLRNVLQRIYKKYTLSSPEIKTGFAIVVTRFDQSSPWHFLNHQGWDHFNSLKTVTFDRLLEGSLAMPSYMPYVILKTEYLGDIVIGDGGFAIGNDSSLYALLLASNHEFPYKWRFGENMLSLTTVGSKGRRVSTVPSEFQRINILKQMPLLIDTLLLGAAANSELLLKALSGDEMTGISKTPILTSHRYDILLSPDSLLALGLNIDYKSFDALFKKPTSQSMDFFLKVGKLAGDKQITMDHFSASFDVRNINHQG